MENTTRVWRLFFAVGLFAIAIQELVNKDFVLVILPAGFPAWLTNRLIWDWVFSLPLAIACICIILEIKARPVSLIIGGILLLLVILFQVPGQHTPMILAAWVNPFKELTLSGGAFLAAGSLARENKVSPLENFLEKLIPAGKYFFAITMVLFGYMHFLYRDFVVPLVPNWIPWHLFWTYFAGAALMAGGLGIIINVKRHLAANLLGTAIFIWFVILHIPRAVADPHSLNGNEITSVFEALSFSGIAFLIGRKKIKG
ncbi:MAG: hypothetical protein JST50_00935 [Bacteroidetes bacterium]|jgi:uncharacterized membrane protein|nr:hypothetical protein [Bacteroidota bacterium]